MLLTPSTIGAIQQDPLRRIFKQASLDLRFADNKSLVDATTGANLVDFTRASSGTYVDSEGVIRTATTNLLLRSEEFQTGWGRGGVLAFGSGSVTDAAIAPNGTMTADLITEDTSVSSVHRVSQGCTVAAGSHTASIYAKRANGIRNVEINANALTNARAVFDLSSGAVGEVSNGTASIQSVGNGWYRCSVTGVSVGGASTLFIQIATDTTAASSTYTGDGTSGIYLWGAQLEQSTTVGEYILTTSTINSAPRFDHDPTTGESLGLLVEEQRSNLFLQSERIDQSPWTLTLASVVAETSVLPNGGNNAYKLVPDSGSGAGLCRQNPTLADNTVYTISIFAKAAGFSQFFIQLFDKAGTFAQSRTIDLSTGGVSGSETGSSITSAVNYGNGWYRLILANVNSLSGATTPNVRFRVAGTGDGTSGIYFWGAQLEAGSGPPTSYIPTTAATATRAADVASISGSNLSSWYAQHSGTFFAAASSQVFDANQRGIICLRSDSARGYYGSLTGSPERLRLGRRDDITNVSAGDLLVSAGDIKVAVNLNLAQSRASVNGAAIFGGGPALTLGNITTLQIGRQEVVGNPVNSYLSGHIKRITYWPSELPDSTLQTITQ
jgi:hypothetical protein